METTVSMDIRALIPLAQEVSETLKAYATRAGLVVDVRGQKYLRAEGWYFVCISMGIPIPRIVEIRPAERTGGHYAYIATAETEWMGHLYQATALCASNENGTRGEYAVLSKAQTRAVVKLIRLLVGWVPPMAGYQATPYEEVEEPTVEVRPVTIPELRNRARALFANQPNRFREILRVVYDTDSLSKLTAQQRQELAQRFESIERGEDFYESFPEMLPYDERE